MTMTELCCFREMPARAKERWPGFVPDKRLEAAQMLYDLMKPQKFWSLSFLDLQTMFLQVCHSMRTGSASPAVRGASLHLVAGQILCTQQILAFFHPVKL